MTTADVVNTDPTRLAGVEHDLVVIGGGIHGVMLALEATRRQLTCLLLERDDFGAHTSRHHLGILHGGFRYLQSLDWRRFRESAQERNWFLQQFPDQTRPLRCLLPLYGDGVRRPAILRAALRVDALLSPPRPAGVPVGRVLSPQELRREFPGVRDGVRGAACWYDGIVEDPEGLLTAVLCRARAAGAQAVDHVRAESLVVRDGAVAGVRAVDRRTDQPLAFPTRCVINAAGPWCREVAAALDGDQPSLMGHAVLVWNLLLDRPALGDAAVAVTPPRPGAHTYFLVGRDGRLLAGTGHATCPVGRHEPPTDHQVSSMLADLNDAVPGLAATPAEVKAVHWGVMPGDAQGRLASRPAFVSHGPTGLHSLCGNKFTTARATADRVLTRLFPRRRP